MRVGLYLSVLGCVAVLGMATPTALAAPTGQSPMPLLYAENAGALLTPALAAAIRTGVEQVFPADVIATAPMQLLPLPGNEFLLDHPALYWRVEQMPAADALARELAEVTPGWRTAVSDGPQGHGVYLIYRLGA